MSKKSFIQCSTRVNRDGIRRETINGVEHIIVVSHTLPDNVVMNGGLYPAEEIAASFESLERTLAPVEHPQDADGNFISASDPMAIHNYHAGAFNVNVTRENGRVTIEKFINVQEALKTERGKRLLDRIDEMETNENPRPVHTSVGVFLIMEDLEQPQTNAAGDEYTWVAREMVFDHDAILLDSVGAATPEKGVGMFVNAKAFDSTGNECSVQRVQVNHTDKTAPHVERVVPVESSILQFNADIGTTAITEQLIADFKNKLANDWVWIVDLFESDVIFETESGFFTVPWRIDDETARIVGIPVRVDRVVTYTPKVNSQTGDDMKELILNALKKAGVEGIDEMSETELFDEYNKLQANANNDGEPGDGDNTDIAAVVANAVAPLTEQVNKLTEQLNKKNDEDKTKLVDVIVNSGKYPGLDNESAQLLPVEKLREFAANCGHAHGLPIHTNDDESGHAAPSKMPE